MDDTLLHLPILSTMLLIQQCFKKNMKTEVKGYTGMRTAKLKTSENRL